MDKCIDYFGDANIFTTLDVNRGYLEIDIRNQEKDKMDFSYHGIYKSIRMLFALKIAPGKLQSVIDEIVSQVKWKYAPV